MHRTSPVRRAASEERILRVLRANPTQSQDMIAYASNYARCTVQRILIRLEYHGRVARLPGRGPRPNTYQVLD
jgi:DNA-binding IclR family transcriptional regulator